MTAAQGSLQTMARPAPRSRRWLPRRFLPIYLVWLAVTALVVTPEIAQYDAESARIAELADQLAGSTTSAQETAERFVDAVRDRLAPRDPAAPSPGALGATAWSTWASGVGSQREGVRLIVSLLLARDIAASPVILTSSATGFRHVAVGYQAGRNWRLIDAHDGPADFRQWSDANDRPLHLLVTSEPTAADAGHGAVIHRAANPWFDRFSFFDWQDVLGGQGFEVYQRTPFPGWLTTMIESPPVLLGLLKIAAAFGVLLVLRALWQLLSHRRATAGAVA
jgi:hypothetical protein